MILFWAMAAPSQSPDGQEMTQKAEIGYFPISNHYLENLRLSWGNDLCYKSLFFFHLPRQSSFPWILSPKLSSENSLGVY